MKVLVLAGGGGTRLWPLSTQNFPKQFLYLGDHLSLLQKTVKRFLHAGFVENIVVATNVQYRELVELQLQKIDAAKKIDILVEPARRNTAAAIALGVKFFQMQKGAKEDDVILVIPSDHLIEPESVFLRYLNEMEHLARQDRMILFGIRPTHPETGYGYIQIGPQEDALLYRVERFVEKPDRTQAEQYLAMGNYYWNAGIFAFTPSLFWGEVKICAPLLYEKMQGDFADVLAQFSQLSDLSIDYAILEKTKRVAVCPMAIHWSDVGSWDSVYEALSKDLHQNVKIGNVLEMDTRNCLIFAGKKLVSTVGLENLLIVDTEDATFISKKGESQKVKGLVQELAMRPAPPSDTVGQHSDFGYVNQLYTVPGCSVFRYQITSRQFLNHSVKEHELWITLVGEVEFSWEGGSKKLCSGQSLKFEEPFEVAIENCSNESIELLLVVHVKPHS